MGDRAMTPMVLTPHGSWWLGDLPLIPVRYEQAASLALASGFWPAISLILGFFAESFDVSPSSGVIVTSLRNNLPRGARRRRFAVPLKGPSSAGHNDDRPTTVAGPIQHHKTQQP